MDGGTRQDIAPLEQFFTHYEKPWKLLHNAQPVYLNQSLREGLDECISRLTAIVYPQVRLDDERWFGKVQQIFHRDPRCFLVDTLPNTKSATLYPMNRSHMHATQDGCCFAIGQTFFLKRSLPYGKGDPINHWSKSAMSGGGTSWTAPGVRYHLVECQKHETWREPLASRNPSA